MICRNCNRENPTEARFCLQCGAQISQLGVPAIDRTVMDNATSTGGERRQVSIMFCDLVGSTELSNRIDAEDLRNIISTYQNACEATITRQQGFIARYFGDGILVYFGYPKALGDDAIRAVRTSVDIIRKIKKISTGMTIPLQVRIGIETGSAVIGDVVGEGVSREISVIGETPNIAARLQSLAKPNSVVIGPSTRRLVNRAFELEAMGRHQLKGITEAVAVWTVQRETQSLEGRPGSSVSILTQFTGREVELECVDKALEEVRSNQIRVVNLSGEAGIGKSRLVQQFRERQASQTTNFWEAQCTAIDQMTPYHPFIQCMRQQLKIETGTRTVLLQQVLEKRLITLGLSCEDTLPYLLNLLDAENRPPELAGVASDVIGYRTNEALTSLIFAKAQFTPLVLIIEDAHWIDSASERLLETLIGSEEETRLLILCTFRSEYSPSWGEATNSILLSISHLTKNEVKRFLQHYFGTEQIDAGMVNTIADKTDGNPLFIEEITCSLVSHDLINRQDGQGLVRLSSPENANIPDTLQYILLSRIDCLDHEKRGVLQVASVIGREFPVPLLSAAAHLDNLKVEKFCSRAGKEENIVNYDREASTEQCKFRHALIQETLYNSLLRDRRRKLHQAVGEAIEAIYSDLIHEWIEPLAHHFSQSSVLDKTVMYLTMAAEKALEVYSFKEAETRLEQALSIIDSAPEEIRRRFLVRLVLGRMRLMYLCRSFHDTMEFGNHYAPLLEQYGSDRDIAMQSFWLGHAQAQCGAFEQARELLQDGLHKAENLGDAECIAYTTTGLAWVTWMSRTKLSCEAVPQLCSTALEIAHGRNMAMLAILATLVLGFDRASRGLSSESRTIGRGLVSMGRNNKDRFAVAGGLNIMAWADLAEEEFDSCIQNAEESLRVSPSPVDKLSCRAAIGAATALMGKGQEGYEIIKAVRQEASDIGMFGIFLGVDIPFGAAIVLKGEMSRGIRWINKRIDEIQECGNDGIPVMGHIILGEIYLGMLTREQKIPLIILLRNIIFLLLTLPFASKKAMAHFVLAENMARNNHAPGFLARALVNMAHLHVRARRYEKARDTLREVTDLAPSLNSIVLDRKISELREVFSQVEPNH